MNILEFSIFFNKIVPLFIIAVFGVVFLRKQLMDKGMLKKKAAIAHEDTNIRGSKKRDVSDFNVIEDIIDNIVVTEKKTKFTTGLICEGVSFDKLAFPERKMVHDNYLGFCNIINWPIQLYIQSRNMDVDDNLKYVEETRDLLKADLENKQNRKNQLKAVLEESPIRKEAYEQELQEIDKTISNISWMIYHKEEELAYAKAIASPGNAPQFDLYIIFSYEYNSSNFTYEMNEQDIYKTAKNDLDIKLATISTVMSRCMVECKPLTKSQIVEVMYRAYNLSDADEIKLKDILKTSTFDLYTTTNDHIKENIQEIANKFQQSIMQDGGTLNG